MQSYPSIPGNAKANLTFDRFSTRDDSIASNFSGTVFPASALLGQFVLRTDQNKLYITTTGGDTPAFGEFFATMLSVVLDDSLEFSGGNLQRAALTGDISAAAGSNVTAIGAGKVTFTMLAAAAIDTDGTGASVSSSKLWASSTAKTYVDAKVAALVNSSPAALDTLNELAAALGNDANFATTVATSLGLKAPLASPTFTGTPAGPTAAPGTNTTQFATTAFVKAAIDVVLGGVSSALDTLSEIATELGLKAPTASPTFTGTPVAPTASAGTNTTQIATTAFVKAAVDVVLGGVSAAFDTLSEIETALGLKAPVANPTFTGTPAAPTASAGTNTTQLASTAFVKAAVDAAIAGVPAAAIIGSVLDFAGSSAPSGWLLCYGQPVSRSTYSALYGVIGTTFGVGDGSTTFNLPDLRGRVAAGKDDMGGSAASRLTNSGTGNPGIAGATLGAVGGVDRHVLTTAQMPAHGHTIPGYATAGGTFSGGNSYQMVNEPTNQGTPGVASVGSDNAHPNAQPTIVLNKIIYTGV